MFLLEGDSSEDIATVLEEDSISEFASSSSESEYLSDSYAKDAEHTNNGDVDVLPPDDLFSSNVTTPADDKDYDVGQHREWKKKEKEKFSAIFDQPEEAMFSFLGGRIKYSNSNRIYIVWAKNKHIFITLFMALVLCNEYFAKRI